MACCTDDDLRFYIKVIMSQASIHSALESAQVQAIETHLKECEQCRKRRDGLVGEEDTKEVPSIILSDEDLSSLVVPDPEDLENEKGDNGS